MKFDINNFSLIINYKSIKCLLVNLDDPQLNNVSYTII